MNEHSFRERQNISADDRQTTGAQEIIPEETFRYTFKAKEQREIERIRRKYAGEEEIQDPLQRVRALDKRVNDKASALSLAIGIIGALILGLGMSCAMVFQGAWFIPGTFIGIAGIGVIVCAYPVYRAVLKAERKKAAPEILRLCEELKGNSPQN